MKSRPLSALVAAVIFACGGCQQNPAMGLKVHYLPGFVPGTAGLFAPAALAIAPPQGRLANGRVRVGAIFNINGKAYPKLYAEDPGAAVAEALARGFADAGLKPVALSAVPADRKPPDPAQFLLVTSLERFQVDKIFRPQTTVHGQYFTMHSMVTIGVELFDRDGHPLFSGSLTGAEDEPPATVGGEAFLPLETEPAESLSVALSRAVGAIILAPEVRNRLPARIVAAARPVFTWRIASYKSRESPGAVEKAAAKAPYVFAMKTVGQVR